MPTSFKQCTPSVKNLFLMLFWLCLPLFGSAQSGVEAAEKNLLEAEKDVLVAKNDTNDLVKAFTSISNHRLFIKVYLLLAYQKEGLVCTVCEDIKFDDLYKDIREADSLKKIGQKPTYFVDILRDGFTSNHISYSSGLSNLAFQLSKMSKYQSYVDYERKNYLFYKRIAENIPSTYMEKASAYASALIRMDYHSEARTVLEETLLFAKKNPIDTANFRTYLMGYNHFGMYDMSDAIADKNLAYVFFNLGNLYENTGEWDKSVAAYQKAMTLYETAPNIHYSNKTAQHQRRFSIQYAYRYVFLCYPRLNSVLCQQGRYEEALALLDDLEKNKIPIYKAHIAKLDTMEGKVTLEETIAETPAQILSYRLFTYFEKRDYAMVKKLLKQQKIEGNESNQSMIALMDFMSGHVDEALQKIDKETNSVKAEFGKNSDFYLMALSSKNNYLLAASKFAEAKADLDEMILLSQNKQLPAKIEADIFDNYASWALRVGQKQEGLRYQKLYFDSKTKQLPPLSNQMVKELDNLGNAYLDNDILDSASYYLNRALTVLDTLAGKKSINYPNILSDLGNLAFNKGNFKEAESLMRQVVALLEPDSSYMPLPLSVKYNALIPSLIANGKYAEAEQYRQKAWKIRWEAFKDSLQGGLLKNLRYGIQIAEAQGKTDLALSRTEGWLDMMRHYLEQNFAYMLQEEKVNLILSLEQDFTVLTASLSRIGQSGGGAFYDLALLEKSIALTDTRVFQKRVADLPDGAEKNAALQLVAKTRLLNNDNIALSFRANLGREADSLRNMLHKTTSELFKKSWSNITWRSVQQKLNADEVAIEFFDAHHHSVQGQKDSIHYYALVLKATGNPIIIPLFEEKKMTQLFDASIAKVPLDDKSDSLVVSDAETVKMRYDGEIGRKLYDLIWRPLENAQILRGIRTVHFSPSGKLNQLPFAALPVNAARQRLFEKYELRQHSTTREIGAIAPKLTKSTFETVIFGGINHNRLDVIPDDNNTYATSMGATSALDNSELHCFKHLRLTKESVQKIYQLFKSKDTLLSKQVHLYTDSLATEEVVRSLGNRKGLSPTIIHFQTHAYTNASKYPESAYSSAALHRSGLVLAGANRKMCDHLPNIANRHDGILTAYEIAQLNLSNTQLVVLGGCQSGLGKVQGREGVFGLTRGFKLAGVDYIIASLWEVPERETAEFMETFYAIRLSETRSVPEAFDKTREKMRQKQPTYSWGAWILTR